MEGAALSLLPSIPASSRQEQGQGEGHPEEPRRAGPGSRTGQGQQDAAISESRVPLPGEGRTQPTEPRAWLCQTLTPSGERFLYTRGSGWLSWLSL